MPQSNRSAAPLVNRLARGLPLAVLALLAACASNSQLTLTPRAEVANPTEPFIIARQQTHWVGIELVNPEFSNEIEELPTFAVRIENRGDSPLTFLPSAISASSGDQPVRVYEPSELAARIQERAAREAEEYTGQQAEVFLQSAATRSDPSAALATISAAKRANRAAGERKSVEQQLSEVANLMVAQTIEPGQAAIGLVKLHADDIQPDQPLSLAFTVDGETYPFTFDVEK